MTMRGPRLLLILWLVFFSGTALAAENPSIDAAEDAAALSDAIQHAREKVEAEGPLEARATTPESPAGKMYAKGFFSKGGGLEKTTNTVGGGLRSADEAVTGGAIEHAGDEAGWEAQMEILKEAEAAKAKTKAAAAATAAAAAETDRGWNEDFAGNIKAGAAETDRGWNEDFVDDGGLGLSVGPDGVSASAGGFDAGVGPDGARASGYGANAGIDDSGVRASGGGVNVSGDSDGVNVSGGGIDAGVTVDSRGNLTASGSGYGANADTSVGRDGTSTNVSGGGVDYSTETRVGPDGISRSDSVSAFGANASTETSVGPDGFSSRQSALGLSTGVDINKDGVSQDALGLGLGVGPDGLRSSGFGGGGGGGASGSGGGGGRVAKPGWGGYDGGGGGGGGAWGMTGGKRKYSPGTPGTISVVGSSEDSSSFTAPASDLSVVFLGNLFGLVDGVLHGSGSQIMGVIFNVFNSAVLALGGIVMMYIIMVSTMNTAHEGQMLGQKWSSIWVPVRATMGLALLIPKSSGYCLMQIFVMWVVVQGVGIADKVWGTALDYLNRGGVIMQAQINPTVSKQAGIIGSDTSNSVIGGASVILYGQVCMLALQTQLENQRKLDLDAKKEDSGPCSGTPSGLMQQFCDNSVPDFLGTVDPLSEYTKNPDGPYSVPMPHFDTAPYNTLNGVCGTLKWASLDMSSIFTQSEEEEEEEEFSDQTAVLGRAIQRATDNVEAAGPLEARATVPGSPVGKVYAFNIKSLGGGSGLSGAVNPNIKLDTGGGSGQLSGGGFTTQVDGASKINTDPFLLTASDMSASSSASMSSGDFEIIKKSRAAGIAQMYTTLASTARAIVGNDPEINANGGEPSDYASPVADYQFGIPLTSSRTVCQSTDAGCPYWGKLPSVSAPVLLDGTELQDAVTDYNAVMQPALKLLNDAKDKKKMNSGRAFISQAKRSGWVLAGSYFFHLVRLNGSSTATSDKVDSNSGLGASTFDLDGVNGVCSSGHPYADLCAFFSGTETKINQITALFEGPPGVGVSQENLSASTLKVIPDGETSPKAASTVYGYANNAMLIDLPGQSGLTGFKVKFGLDQLKIKIKSKPIHTPTPDCNGFSMYGVPLCFGKWMELALWNTIKHVVNPVLDFSAEAGTLLINTVVIMPLKHFVHIFEDAMAVIAQPGINPVLGLAMMGVKYINMSMDTWMSVVLLSVSIGLVPLVGPVLLMALPLFTVWVGIMVGIGYVTAYYIPFLPYMIFTFGALAWFIAVVEAMAAAPLVALGISHPEGHDAMGKAEPALMLLLNVFLRPAMMVIGFLASIAMCYVGVWLLNSGFSTLVGYLDSAQVWTATEQWSLVSTAIPWSKIYGYFFVIIIYTTIYLTLVEKSFSLIAVLPDKVLRWIGGQQEGIGAEASQWTSDVKGKVDKGAEGMDKASGAMEKTMSSESIGAVMKAGSMAKGMVTGGGSGGSASSTGKPG